MPEGQTVAWARLHEGGVALRCDRGHWGTILRPKSLRGIGPHPEHRIGPGGEVQPSCVCPTAGCGFHEFVTLDAWAPAG